MTNLLRLCARGPIVAAALVSALALAGPAFAHGPDREAVADTYGDIAEAMYADALARAHELDAAIDIFVAAPSADGLAVARKAWLAAREPYQQTEVYRFGNAIVDNWEGKVNAWPLDEGLIDYVDRASYGDASDENPLYTANVVASDQLQYGADTIDTAAITKELLSNSLHEVGQVESNVATGYHAIEFLLWGQDLHGTDAGAGERPWTDYATGSDCTNGSCERRAAYLATASDLLVDDLTWMASQWQDGGAARQALADAGPDGAVSSMLTGLGSLSYGELAGERMQLGLLLHDPEEEHDCFSDNTHMSHYYDIVGMRSVYLGKYTRIDGTVVSGPSLSELVAASDPDLDASLRAELDSTVAAAQAMVDRAGSVEAYDQMIGEGNDEGNATVQAVIDALTVQTRSIERAVATLSLEPIAFEGSDSLDNPEAVFQ
ncbi:MAG: imelysin family protein [Dongiaceae bacterium]